MYSIWQGDRVRLRAVEPEDWEVFASWRHDTEMARLGHCIEFPASREMIKHWTTSGATTRPENDCFRFVIENQDDTLVGTINTHGCERRHGTFKYGIAIGREHRRKGYAADAIRILLRYFFFELGHQKVTVDVYAFNTTSITLHERLGFQHEGRLRRLIRSEGALHDVHVFGMTVEEFETKWEGQ